MAIPAKLLAGPQHLQQVREFAVSKTEELGPAPPLLAQSADAVAQSQQLGVDVGSFLHLALVLSLLGGKADGTERFQNGGSAPAAGVWHDRGRGLGVKTTSPAKST